MAPIDRLLTKYPNTTIANPVPVAMQQQINNMLLLPANQMALNALLSSPANHLVNLVTTPQMLQKLVITVRGHPTMLPGRVIDVLVRINQLTPNITSGVRDIVLGFNSLLNFQHIQDPIFNKLITALDQVIPGLPGLVNFIHTHTFDHLRTILRNVEERYLADALRVIGRFHGTPHAGQLTQAYLPAWSKVYHYCPPNGKVSAGIRFNAALLTDHVRKHVFYEQVNGHHTPDNQEPLRWIDFLDYRDRITPTWVLQWLPQLSGVSLQTLFGTGNILLNTPIAKRHLIMLLSQSQQMRDDLRITKRIERDYEAVAIRTIRHGQKFVHYTAGNAIFITGSLNGMYVMARFVDNLGEFAISTAYLPSATDLAIQLAQWGPSTVWNLV